MAVRPRPPPRQQKTRYLGRTQVRRRRKRRAYTQEHPGDERAPFRTARTRSENRRKTSISLYSGPGSPPPISSRRRPAWDRATTATGTSTELGRALDAVARAEETPPLVREVGRLAVPGEQETRLSHAGPAPSRRLTQFYRTLAPAHVERGRFCGARPGFEMRSKTPFSLYSNSTPRCVLDNSCVPPRRARRPFFGDSVHAGECAGTVRGGLERVSKIDVWAGRAEGLWARLVCWAQRLASGTRNRSHSLEGM